MGRKAWKVSTNRKLGTAAMGWGRLEKMPQKCGLPDRRSPRYQYQGDGQPFRNVVNGNRRSDEGCQSSGAAERDTNTDTFGERVRRHDRNNKECALGIDAREARDLRTLVMAEILLGGVDGYEANQDSKDQPRWADRNPLGHEPVCRSEHQSGRDGVCK